MLQSRLVWWNFKSKIGAFHFHVGYTLLATNSQKPLKIGGWKMKIPFGVVYFSDAMLCYVSFREGLNISQKKHEVVRPPPWPQMVNTHWLYLDPRLKPRQITRVAETPRIRATHPLEDGVPIQPGRKKLNSEGNFWKKNPCNQQHLGETKHLAKFCECVFLCPFWDGFFVNSSDPWPGTQRQKVEFVTLQLL